MTVVWNLYTIFQQGGIWTRGGGGVPPIYLNKMFYIIHTLFKPIIVLSKTTKFIRIQTQLIKLSHFLGALFRIPQY